MSKRFESKMNANINLDEARVYVVSDGKLTKLDKPQMGYGKQEIYWQNGKVTHVDYKYSQKL